MKLQDIRNYIEAHYNQTLSNLNLSKKEIEDLASTRAKMCLACPHLEEYTTAITKTKKQRCGKCGCEYPSILYSPSKKCPIGKW
jgi:phosphoribosylformylglycinamidine (FGAM) synthase-like amidotransferase family enzyme